MGILFRYCCRAGVGQVSRVSDFRKVSLCQNGHITTELQPRPVLPKQGTGPKFASWAGVKNDTPGQNKGPNANSIHYIHSIMTQEGGRHYVDKRWE